MKLHFEQQIKDFITKNNLIPKGSKVLVAVSGGADSVCLLHALHKVSGQNSNFEIAVCTINHHLRQEAFLETEFVAKMCEKLGVLCFVKNVYLKDDKNVEENAREMRYDVLNTTLLEWGGDLIATAHNKNDQAETILLRILRGTSVRGLGGIQMKNNNIIRPLLLQTREDILYYLKGNSFEFMTDKSNFSREYTRNKLRLDLLPLIEDGYSTNILELLTNLAESASSDNECLDALAKKYFNENYEYRGAELLLKIDESLHPSIIKRVFRQAIIEIYGTDKNVSYSHYFQLLKLKTGERLSIFKKLLAIPCGNGLYLFTKNEINDTIYITTKIIVGNTYDFLGNNVQVDCNKKSGNRENSCEFCTCSIDKKKVVGELTLSSNRDGQSIVVGGQTKSLQDIFVNAYVPRHLRSSVPIISDEQGVVAVLGYRVADRVAADENTEKYLNILVEWKNNPWMYRDLKRR